MKETIILAPGCNGTELGRALARFGRKNIGYRIIGSVDLAKLALMKSGVCVAEDFLTLKEQSSVIYSFIHEITYFKAASFSDAEALANAINEIRELVCEDEDREIREALSKGKFTDKNDALIEAYEKYKDILESSKKTDGIELIKRAIEKGEPFDGTFCVLEEYPLSPLERKLIDKVSAGNLETKQVMELFEAEIKRPEAFDCTSGYGYINEVSSLIDRIYSNKMPLDSCIVAYPGGSAYPQVFFDLSKHYDIPVTFGSGIPITNSYPAMLLKIMNKWDTFGYHGYDSLKEMVFCNAFDISLLNDIIEKKAPESGIYIDDVCQMAGQLRISCNGETNRDRILKYRVVLTERLKYAEKIGRKADVAEKNCKILDCVEAFGAELGKGFVYFFDKFVKLRTANRIDKSAKQVIMQMLDAYHEYMPEPDGDTSGFEEIIPQILEKSVCSENSKEGYLHIVPISGAMACIRPNLYICGMSAVEFPGSPRENYMLLDEDLLAFGHNDAPTSGNRIEQNKRDLDALITLANSIGAQVKFSYSDFSLSDLKEKNPSSALYKYFESVYPGRPMEEFLESIKKAGYFDSRLDQRRLVAQKQAEGSVISFKKEEKAPVITENLFDKPWSPSALDVFYQCPRHFFLTKIMKIEEENDDNPFSVLRFYDEGTIAHSLMEMLAETRMGEDEFMEAADKAFEDFLTGRPPMHRAAADEVKRKFINMMKDAYRQEISNSYKCLDAENKYHHTHSSGITLHGYPDRVEVDAEGNKIIADFKTKKTVEHVENDINSCLQVVIYAWLCKQEGIDISRCEYRYLKKDRVITCVYNDDMEKSLESKLNELADAFRNNVFERRESSDNCRYCKCKDICNW